MLLAEERHAVRKARLDVGGLLVRQLHVRRVIYKADQQRRSVILQIVQVSPAVDLLGVSGQRAEEAGILDHHVEGMVAGIDGFGVLLAENAEQGHHLRAAEHKLLHRSVRLIVEQAALPLDDVLRDRADRVVPHVHSPGDSLLARLHLFAAIARRHRNLRLFRLQALAAEEGCLALHLGLRLRRSLSIFALRLPGLRTVGSALQRATEADLGLRRRRRFRHGCGVFLPCVPGAVFGRPSEERRLALHPGLRLCRCFLLRRRHHGSRLRAPFAAFAEAVPPFGEAAQHLLGQPRLLGSFLLRCLCLVRLLKRSAHLRDVRRALQAHLLGKCLLEDGQLLPHDVLALGLQFGVLRLVGAQALFQRALAGVELAAQPVCIRLIVLRRQQGAVPEAVIQVVRIVSVEAAVLVAGLGLPELDGLLLQILIRDIADGLHDGVRPGGVKVDVLAVERHQADFLQAAGAAHRAEGQPGFALRQLVQVLRLLPGALGVVLQEGLFVAAIQRRSDIDSLVVVLDGAEIDPHPVGHDILLFLFGIQAGGMARQTCVVSFGPERIVLVPVFLRDPVLRILQRVPGFGDVLRPIPGLLGDDLALRAGAHAAVCLSALRRLDRCRRGRILLRIGCHGL